jgi:hypothetical protein
MEKVQMKPPDEVLYSDALMQIKAVPLLEVGSRGLGGGEGHFWPYATLLRSKE